ncbi:MAG: DUF5666 domain-containing protein [Gemmatimonadaceae bacterium]
MRATGAVLICWGVAISACSKTETRNSATPADSTSASAPGGAPKITGVRGSISTMSDTMLVVTTSAGDIHVALPSPPQVYSRGPADLSEVKENSFVGVTSVKQPDGTQQATEIHIFPDDLRGSNEGSFLMRGQSSGGSPSTMTNGTVEAPRMTNGTIGATAGGKLVVNYRGGSQTISIPSGVKVTKISPTDTKLAPGTNVVVLATKRPDGTLTASRVLLAGGQ